MNHSDGFAKGIFRNRIIVRNIIEKVILKLFGSMIFLNGEYNIYRIVNTANKPIKPKLTTQVPNAE